MKIAYISPIYFSDVDLSYLSHIQSNIDITYFVPLFNNQLKGAAFNLQKHYNQYGIFLATNIYPELATLGKIIDTTKFYIINSPAKRRWHPLNIWLYIKFIWKLRKYDVIHITEFPHYYEWGYYFLRKKIILTVHDPIPHPTIVCNTHQIQLNRKLGFKFFKNFIILNQAQKNDCIKINKLQNKNIYDSQLGRYDYLKIYETTKTDDQKYILFFGQIASNKGLDILFPAMQEVHKTCPDTQLIVAGKGLFSFDISPYQNLRYIDIRNYFIPDHDLATLIQNSMFVVCPYKDATQSGVVMSAFAFNKPVIATNVGGFPEQVIHSKFGLIVEPNNVSALADAICKLCTDHDLMQQLQDNIRIHYEENGINSWQKIVSDMTHIYTTTFHPKYFFK